MLSKRVRRFGIALAVAALAATLPVTSVHAVGNGDVVTNGTYAFTAKINFGDLHSCTGALVDRRWVVTAKSCFADGSTAITAGPPTRLTSVLVGRTDLSTYGSRLNATSVIPHPDRNVALVELSAEVGVTPIAWATSAPTTGETLRVAGYGRTATQWVPDRLHAASFTVQATTDTTINVIGAAPGATICKGDAGGPAFRENPGQTELIAINNTSWQKGCLGETETRDGATQTRLDDLATWFQDSIREQPHALVNTVAGEFNRDAYQDLMAVEASTGKLWLYPGTATAGLWGDRVQVHAGAGIDWNGYRDFVVGRFNRTDNYDDLIAIERSTSTLWMWPGTADGTNFGTRVQVGTKWDDLSELAVGKFNRGDDYDDILAVQKSTDRLLLYPGTAAGTGWGAPSIVGTGGWNSKRELVAGQFNRDTYDDLLVIDKATGLIRFYPGTATGGGSWGTSVEISPDGGKTLSDLAVGRFNSDGFDDLIAVETSADQVWFYPGTTTGGAFGPRFEPAGRLPVLQPYNLLEAVSGEFNRDGIQDLIVKEPGTGRLWLHPGTAIGVWGKRIQVGSGWESYRELTVGRFNRDDYDDLLAVEEATGTLWLYPGTATGTTWGSRQQVGTNWLGLERLTSGKFNRDDYDDVIAVEKNTGKLRLYPGTAAGSSWGPSTIIDETDWRTATSGLEDLVRGRFNRDGYDDVIVTDGKTGQLWLYPGTAEGGAFGPRVEVLPTGWIWTNTKARVALRLDPDGYDDLLAQQYEFFHPSRNPVTNGIRVYPGTPSGGAAWGEPIQFGPHKEPREFGPRE